MSSIRPLVLLTLLTAAGSAAHAEFQHAIINNGPPFSTYHNTLTKLDNPPPLLADYPQYFQPIVEETRYEAPAIVKDENADLDVRAWRFSYNARGIIEMPNHLRASETAILVVHPWAIDDHQGWRSPEPAGVADFCTPAKNDLSHDHIKDVLNPFLKRMRDRVGMVVYSQRGEEKPVLAKMYRTIRKNPSAEERAEGAAELKEILNSFDYNAENVPDRLVLTDDFPVADYFRDFPGLDSGDHYNGKGFWELPVPVVDSIEVAPDDVVHYDADGYDAIRDFLKAHGIRHILMTGYATDMCYKSTTCGYENFSKDFNVFLVGDATMATFPANSSPAYATNAAISFASLNQLITQVSWIKLSPAESK